MSDKPINTDELRKLIDTHGPPLSPMLIYTLLDEIDRVRAGYREARLAEERIKEKLREILYGPRDGSREQIAT